MRTTRGWKYGTREAKAEQQSGSGQKRSALLYSFDMEAQLFTGFRNGEFEADGKGGTIFTATEYICIKNPVIKILSYLFFNIGKLMDSYQDDLRRKINETGSTHSDE